MRPMLLSRVLAKSLVTNIRRHRRLDAYSHEGEGAVSPVWL
jgi:hypothetical protein